MNHKGTVTLGTERLILRRYRLGDADDMFRNWGTSEKVTKFLSWEPYADIEELKHYIEYCMENYEKPYCYNWVIEYRENGQVIGALGANWFNEDLAACEIGYCLSDKYWGMGIMPEALGEVIRFLFEEVGMNRIQSTHDVRNPNSGRVMEKCGMRYEGTLRQGGKNNQGICDSVIRAILREDYISDNDHI